MSALASRVREALRRLHHCDGATIEDLAAAARVQPRTIERLAAKERWTRAAGASAATPADRVAALADRLIR